MIICAYCQSEDISVGLSGVKQLSSGESVTYNLCKECCKNVKRISVYRPDELNKRQEFWAKVEAFLDQNAVSG